MEVSGFPHQVGGHFGLFTCAGHVLKPWNTREFAFYKKLESFIMPYVPKICGEIKVSSICQNVEESFVKLKTNKEECSQSPTTAKINEGRYVMNFRIIDGRVQVVQEDCPSPNYWAGQCQVKVVEKLLREKEDYRFMLFEDLVKTFSKPSIIDLKMGTRCTGADAPRQKRLSHAQKCRNSTSKKHGVRMVGMQLYDPVSKNYSYINKYEGRRMNLHMLRNSIIKFLKMAGERRAFRLLEMMKELKKALESVNGYRFFSSSILIAFDGYQETGEPILKMIDFAHSTLFGFMNDRSYRGPDKGYLMGIDTLITIFEKVSHEINEKICKIIPPFDAGYKRKLRAIFNMKTTKKKEPT